MNKHGWNSDYEDVIKTIGEESRAYAWMNRKTGNHRKMLDDLCDISAISLSAIGALLGTALGLISGNPTIILILNIAVPTLAALVSIIMGIKKHYKWSDLYTLNQLMYRKFNVLANECSTILKLHREHRHMTGKQYMEKKSKKYNKLTKSEENNIMEMYRKQFVKDFSKLNINIPGQIKEIVVTKEMSENPNRLESQHSITKALRDLVDSTEEPKYNSRFSSRANEKAEMLMKDSPSEYEINNSLIEEMVRDLAGYESEESEKIIIDVDKDDNLIVEEL